MAPQLTPPPIPDGAKMGSWNGAAVRDPRGARRRRRRLAGGGRRGGGRGDATPEQAAAQQEQAAKMKAWRTSVSMDPFKKLRKMYNDAGVTIYAVEAAQYEHVGRGARVPSSTLPKRSAVPTRQSNCRPMLTERELIVRLPPHAEAAR